MTTSAQNPALDYEIAGMKRRISDLERALADRRNLERPDTTWVLADGLYIREYPPYPVPQRRSYWEAAVELGTPSSSGSVVFTVAIGGVVGLTITIPQGVASLRQPIDLTVSRDAVLTAAITSAGIDATDLTVALRS